MRGRFRGAEVRALGAVSFAVAAGECVGVLGKNGAGKSTLLRCLAGLVSPSAGKASVAGHDCARGGPALRRAAAYLAAEPRSFAWRISGRANLEYFAALHGMDRQAARRRAAEVLALVELDGDRAVSAMSAGQKQRLAIARALLGEPSALLLDEPGSSLDGEGAEILRREVRARLSRGASVLWATHRVEDLAGLAERVLVIDGGRLLHDGAAGAFAGVAGTNG